MLLYLLGGKDRTLIKSDYWVYAWHHKISKTKIWIVFSIKVRHVFDKPRLVQWLTIIKPRIYLTFVDKTRIPISWFTHRYQS